jgi:hypothetical protein
MRRPARPFRIDMHGKESPEQDCRTRILSTNCPEGRFP